MSHKITIYIYSKCSTCTKAVQFLKAHGVHFEIMEINTSPPSINELREMLERKHGEIKRLFNTSGELYRSMQLSTKLKDMPNEKALELLSQNGMLVKRPFVLNANVALLGFKEVEWKSAFHSIEL